MIGCRKDIKLTGCCVILLAFFCAVFSLQAQEHYDITYEDASLKFGAFASPNGYGIFFRNTSPLARSYGRVFDIGFSGVRHFKEKSVLNQRMVNSSPYIYGKVNRLYALRPMLGLQRNLAEKINKNSVGINAFAMAGPTLGLLKPVYMDVEVEDPSMPGFSEFRALRYDPSVQDPRDISGYSPFFKGISETRATLGISLKTGFEFNWGYYSSSYNSLEIGVLIDCFPTRPELMHFIKNKIVYSSFYLSFAFGKNY